MSLQSLIAKHRPCLCWHGENYTIKAGVSWVTFEAGGAILRWRGTDELARLRGLLATFRAATPQPFWGDAAAICCGEDFLSITPAGGYECHIQPRINQDLAAWLELLLGSDLPVELQDEFCGVEFLGAERQPLADVLLEVAGGASSAELVLAAGRLSFIRQADSLVAVFGKSSCFLSNSMLAVCGVVYRG